MIPGSEIEIPGVGVNASRTALLDLLARSGADIARENSREENGEPVADLRVRFEQAVLQDFPGLIDADLIPNLIDEIPALAVFGTRLRKGLQIRDASELRKKESDRIRSIVDNLRSLGIRVDEAPDGFSVTGDQRVQGGRVRTFGDHRIAMAFALAGLISEGPVQLDDAGCAGVSFPDFYGQLELVTR
jgi:3-phosphoshikimate 1-carboxyvinyltransferase